MHLFSEIGSKNEIRWKQKKKKLFCDKNCFFFFFQLQKNIIIIAYKFYKLGMVEIKALNKKINEDMIWLDLAEKLYY